MRRDPLARGGVALGIDFCPLLAPNLQHFQGDGLAATSALTRSPCCVAESAELLACLTRRGDRGRKRNAARGALANQVAAFRVNAAHAPEAFNAAGEPRGVKTDGVRVVGIHVLDDAGLRREQIAGAFGRDPQLGRGEIDDASEAADIVGAVYLKSPERDIGKVGVEGSLWMARQEPSSDGLIASLLGPAEQRHSRALQRIASS